ncbi:hypothetical protein EYF80_039808 [Liparis tanakae]|uniref:Uncharacterized protein n=1 Tax=Liparis tanakae TaxID=230148 RepID=A0A4Z2G9W8_9TELE|nr:hypothetical protein EYF80_039808 [Liparis tanakae]
MQTLGCEEVPWGEEVLMGLDEAVRVPEPWGEEVLMGLDEAVRVPEPWGDVLYGVLSVLKALGQTHTVLPKEEPTVRSVGDSRCSDI